MHPGHAVHARRQHCSWRRGAEGATQAGARGDCTVRRRAVLVGVQPGHVQAAHRQLELSRPCISRRTYPTPARIRMIWEISSQHATARQMRRPKGARAATALGPREPQVETAELRGAASEGTPRRGGGDHSPGWWSFMGEPPSAPPWCSSPVKSPKAEMWLGRQTPLVTMSATGGTCIARFHIVMAENFDSQNKSERLGGLKALKSTAGSSPLELRGAHRRGERPVAGAAEDQILPAERRDVARQQPQQAIPLLAVANRGASALAHRAAQLAGGESVVVWVAAICVCQGTGFEEVVSTSDKWSVSFRRLCKC